MTYRQKLPLLSGGWSMKKGWAIATTTMVVASSFALTAPAALAATGDGALTLRVVEDVNLDSTRDAGDTGMKRVVVKITDDAGKTIVRTTDASGVVKVVAGEAGNTLAGGKYRVDVVNPNAAKYSEAAILDGRTEPQFAPATSFVDVSGRKAVDISVGYIDATRVGAENATIYSAIQPDHVYPAFNAEPREMYSTKYSLRPATVTTVTPKDTLGAVYGIGVDSQTENVYAAAYAKRGSKYGPNGGPGTIYRVNPATGANEVYATVADVGTTQHDSAMDQKNSDQDLAFGKAVGRESLGDLDISKDGKYLTVVNLHTDSVVVYPVQDAVDPKPIQTLEIPAIDCKSDWTPFGLGENEDLGMIYVGATCGATMQTHVIEYERDNSTGKLTATGNVRSGDVSLTKDRAGKKGPHFDIPGCGLVDWRPWTDVVPAECLNYSGASPNPFWGNSPQWVLPQPILADIEFTDGGQMLLSMRDRGGDQFGTGYIMGEATEGRNAGKNVHANNIATGDVVPFDATFDSPTGTLDYANPLYTFDTKGFVHNSAAFSGIVHLRGTNTVVSNHMDATNAINTNGLRAWGVDNDETNGKTQNALTVSDKFLKAMGLADLDAYVEYATQQIGNRIWIDTDGDGIQDPGEPAVAGVQVSLYDEDGKVIATTVTDANGEYYFDTKDGVKPGTTYSIRLDREADFGTDGPLEGAFPTKAFRGVDRGIDSNGEYLPDTTIVAATVTTSPKGANDHSIDFGFMQEAPEPLVSIGDYVWIDRDDTGVQVPGTQGVAGVTVKLLDKDGKLLAETTTDENGYYVFADLQPSTDYIVEFPKTVTVDGEELPLTEPGRGDDEAKDSNAVLETGRAPVTTPASGNNSTQPGRADNPTIDAGYVDSRPPAALVSIGDYVWLDADADGLQSEDELPLSGVKVQLLDENGNVLKETTTDENGYYVFTDLKASTNYVVQFPTTFDRGYDTYNLTKSTQGDDEAVDSNANQFTGRAPVTTPATGNNSSEPGAADNPTIDAGYVVLEQPLVGIGDFVWIDENADGTQDADETPVPGVTVELYDADMKLVATTVTDANGKYAFNNLPAETKFFVKFPTEVTVDGLKHTLTDPRNQSTPNVDTGLVEVTTPEEGKNLTFDAGYVPVPAPPVPVSIGDYVWLDTNRDGVQDIGEPAAPQGTVVRLLDADGNFIKETVTDENGYYAFTDLEPSTGYILEFPTAIEIDGVTWPLTQPGQGDPGSDSNAATDTGRASVTTPATGANSAKPGEADNPTIDAGYVVPLVSVGDYVWLDTNGNGIQDAGEKPVPGVVVTLLDADGNVVKTTTTDANGYYSFTDLVAGAKYSLQFPTELVIDGVKVPLTKPGQGTDQGKDSNADQKSGLVSFTAPLNGNNSANPGEADNPTLDAGYGPAPIEVVPGPEPESQGKLENTGSSSDVLWYGGGAALLLLAAGALLMFRRRNMSRTN